MNETTENNQLNLGVDEDDLPPVIIKPAPGWLQFMPQILQQTQAVGGNLRAEADGKVFLDGFYKNGPMLIEFDEQKNVYAVDRRDRRTAISHLDDFIQLNFNWWRASNTKKTAYTLPEQPWLNYFIEKKWVKRKVVFEPIDDNIEGLHDLD